MTLKVKNSRFYLRDLPDETLIHLKHSFSFINPRTFMDPEGDYPPIRFYNKLVDGLSFPIGLMQRVGEILRKDGIDIQFPANDSGIVVNHQIAGELDPMQEEAVQLLVPRKLAAVELSVGSGKTITMAALADSFLNSEFFQEKVLVVVPKTQLMYQTAQELAKFLPHRTVGMLGDGKRKNGNVIVAISNTVTAASPDVVEILKHVGCIIYDEAHYATSPSWRAIMEDYPSRAIWALSGKLTFDDKMATLEHEAVFGPPLLSGRNETRLCDVEVVVYDKVSKSWAKDSHPGMKKDGDCAWFMPKGQKKWIPAKYHENRVYRGTYYKGQKITAKDGYVVYDTAEDRGVVLHQDRNNWVVETAEALSRRGKVIIVVKRGLHSVVLRHLLKKKFGLVVQVVDGKVKGPAQQEYWAAMERGEINLLIAQQNTMKEGLNIPSLTDLLIASPTRSDQSLEQLKGRVERATDGKSLGRVHLAGDFHNSHLRKINRAMVKYYKGRKRLTLTVV